MARRNAQRGYSLIEALISVGLLAGLASALGPAVFGSTRASTAILEDGKAREALRVADESLARIFENALFVSQDNANLIFKGDVKHLRVISLAGGQSTAREFELEIRNGVLSGKIFPLFDDGNDLQSTEIYPHHVQRFSYYGRPTGNTPIGWRDDWSAPFPPILVRLEIAANGNAPEKIFDYRLSSHAPLHCEFDPVSRRCRR